MIINHVCRQTIPRARIGSSHGSLLKILSSEGVKQSLHWKSSNFRSFSKNLAGRSSQSQQHAQVGTVTTVGSGSQRSLSDLLRKIDPIENPHDGDTSLLIFLTPEYARHAQDPKLPLELLRRLHGDQAQLTNISSITAVVDALAAPNRGHTTTEGIAFALQSGASPLTGREPLRKAAQRAGSFNFNFDLEGSVQQQWRLQMPLSQTIFSTGLTTTLISRFYRNDTSIGNEEQLESVTCSMQWQSEVDAPQIEYPLVQLTTYRTIQNSMGNIIRTLSSHDGQSSKEEPASRGLEEAVSAYFRALDIPPEPVDVWSLIIPRSIVASGTVRDATEALVLDDAALHNLWSTSKSHSKTFGTLLKHQSRLVKVLSGGGGWGKKAGLLSLDPDLEYSTRELRDDHGWNFDFDMGEDDGTPSSIERQLDQALGSSVEEGDGVVFLIDPKRAPQEAMHGSTQRATISFGMCANTDSHGEVSGHAVQDETIAYHPNFFGLLSETGMALQIRDSNGVLTNKTKLEVPGLRVHLYAKQ